MSLIEASDLSFTFPDGTQALKNVSFKIDEHEFVVISGKNGSGKTLLLRIMDGLIKPTSGSMIVAGFSAVKDPAQVREHVGLVFQQSDNQIVAPSVHSDIAFGLENIGMKRSEITERVRRALDFVGLTDHAAQRPRTLSGGEKRRLTIAGVAAMEPTAIALDEPFTNLDYPGVIQVLKLLIRLHKAGHTVIVVTHDLDKILAHADRLILVDEGTVAADGKPEDVISLASRCGVRIPRGFSKESIGEMTWLKD